MSQVLSFTPKATKLTRWPVLSLCCKLLQRTDVQCQFKTCYCLFIHSPFCTSRVRQAFVNHMCVLAGHWNQTLWFPVTHRSLWSIRNRLNHDSWLRLCSVICNGLTLKPCLAGTMTTIKSNQGICVAFALYTAVDLSVAYAPVVACLRWWSGVRCQPCRCRRAWHETCSSVCTPWQASPGHIGAKEQNGRSSESRRSETTQCVMN